MNATHGPNIRGPILSLKQILSKLYFVFIFVWILIYSLFFMCTIIFYINTKWAVYVSVVLNYFFVILKIFLFIIIKRKYWMTETARVCVSMFILISRLLCRNRLSLTSEENTKKCMHHFRYFRFFSITLQIHAHKGCFIRSIFTQCRGKWIVDNIAKGLSPWTVFG